MKRLLYFGCIRQIGHYLWSEGETRVPLKQWLDEGLPRPEELDVTFTPKLTFEAGRYTTNVLREWTVVSWHDYSVDRRPGSHSTLLGIGYANAEEMIDDLSVHYPSVAARQPRPTPV